MPNAVAFTLITPRAIAFEGDAELVIATGTEGEVGILPSHAPFLTALKPGVLRANVRDTDTTTMRLELACGEGFLQALPDKITILTDAALEADEIDVSESRAELAAAIEEQKAAAGDLAAWHRAQSKIDFATAKLKVSGVGA
jgi:F-type H+-transporting ATPase subunit epsilon